jgi:hypothetical protein
MVSVQNLHRPTLWGFFVACTPPLSAEIPGFSVYSPRSVSHRCHPCKTAASHARATPRVRDMWAGLRIGAACWDPDLQGTVIPCLSWWVPSVPSQRIGPCPGTRSRRLTHAAHVTAVECRAGAAAGDPGAPAARRLPQGVRRNHLTGSSRGGAP